ncbi:MAG TPA: ParA family protein [Caldisericia bacterium]|nr:ParA family protein [Caldisericia bacterium]
MIKICINNGKGGVSKTVSTCSIAGILANELDKKVLIIDTDTQANASKLFGHKANDNFAQALEDKLSLQNCIMPTQYKNISIIPASNRLSAIGSDLKSMRNYATVLQDRMAGLNGFNYCLIDTAPSLDVIPQNAMAASDFVLIPLEASEYSIDGLIETRNTVDEIKTRANPGLKILGMFLARVDTRTLFAKQIQSLVKQHWGDLVFETMIRNNISLTESISDKKVITDYAPDSNGSQDYRSLVGEIRTRLGRYAHG